MQILLREIIGISQTLLLIEKDIKQQSTHIYGILLPVNRINYE